MRIQLNSKVCINLLALFVLYIFMDLIWTQYAKNFIARVFGIRIVSEFAAKITRDTYPVNCRLVFEMSHDEIRRATSLNKQLNKTLLPDANFVFAKSKCAEYKEVRGFNSHHVTQFEANFPRAYSILVNEKVEQFER